MIEFEEDDSEEFNDSDTDISIFDIGEDDGSDRGNDMIVAEADDFVEEESVYDKEWFGHGGTEAPSKDTFASYPESHFCETDDRYMDESQEITEATNQRALRELREYDMLQEQEKEEEEQWLQELNDLEDIDYQIRCKSEEKNAELANMEYDLKYSEDKEPLQDSIKRLKKESDDLHSKLNDASYDVGAHIRGC